jgi:bifunctional non-homologous end joining protein LigD
MSLQKYWAKRDFNITQEPRGQLENAGAQLRFYIQKHHARNLHYDFRLEIGGTLKSWAVPKGPSLDPDDKRLAVEVEDHPLAYGSFEGSIPKGQYGAGQVILWDKGTWEAIGDAEQGLKSGSLKFQLHGHKLHGKWALVRMKGASAAESKNNWLLIKEKDAESRKGKDAHITESSSESVNGLPDLEQPTAKMDTENALAITQTSMPIPDIFKPQLATLAAHAPAGEQWLSELKYDGYRALSRIDEGAVNMLTRNGHDWTGKWPRLAEALSELPVSSAWLDGEVAAIDDDGNISFQLLQNAMKQGQDAKLVYLVFDLMYLNGYDLTDMPLIKRKELLQTLLASQPETSAIKYSHHASGPANEVFKQACLQGQEGIVVKNAQAPYVQARTHDWLKVKCGMRQEFVVAGYTDPAGSREKFGALLLGTYDEAGKLIYAGRVGTGFNQDSLKQVADHFPALSASKTSFLNPPTGREAVGVHWLKPKLVAEVKFAQWTEDGLVRHSSFVSLRSDKPAKNIVRELSHAPEEQSQSAVSTVPSSLNRKVELAGVKISNPAKILFIDHGYTKLDIAEHYVNMEQWILPYLKDRPLSIVRCPDGYNHECFFQKHVAIGKHSHLKPIKPNAETNKSEYFIANDLSAIIELVQLGVLELHTWGSQYPISALADRLIFDLDPAPDVAWDKVTEAAVLLKGLLQEIGLQSFVKTTGGKGLHVEVPITASYPWDVVKPFTQGIAQYLEKHIPDRFTASISKKKRAGKIFIDYLRNADGATAIVPYSTRARKGAPVATPLHWDEIGDRIQADSFNIKNIGDRLKHLQADPWVDYLKIKQGLNADIIKLFSTAV